LQHFRNESTKPRGERNQDNFERVRARRIGTTKPTRRGAPTACDRSGLDSAWGKMAKIGGIDRCSALLRFRNAKGQRARCVGAKSFCHRPEVSKAKLKADFQEDARPGRASKGSALNSDRWRVIETKQAGRLPRTELDATEAIEARRAKAICFAPSSATSVARSPARTSARRPRSQLEPPCGDEFSW